MNALINQYKNTKELIEAVLTDATTSITAALLSLD